MHKHGTVAALVALLAIGCGGAAGNGDTTPDEPATLYERLGGEAAIAAVVDDFVASIGADDRINHYFVEVDTDRFKALLVEFLCEETGGPCTYRGRSIRAAHTGMNISEEDWAVTVQALTDALDKHNVPARDKDELIGALGALKGDIVGQ